jgi:hypothetical protein
MLTNRSQPLLVDTYGVLPALSRALNATLLLPRAAFLFPSGDDIFVCSRVAATIAGYTCRVFLLLALRRLLTVNDTNREMVRDGSRSEVVL